MCVDCLNQICRCLNKKEYILKKIKLDHVSTYYLDCFQTRQVD
jgi:hypothetical protein